VAELRVKGEWVGPGEKRTAKYLSEHLPDDWIIFAGRKLAGENRDDVDLIIVSKSKIFVLDEKSWGPRIVVDDSFWYVNGASRVNPLVRVGQLARKVAGKLRDHAKGYRTVPGKRVVPGLVLSHRKLQVFQGPKHDVSENIWSLEEAPDHLIAIDQTDNHLGIARGAVLAYLDDLPAGGKIHMLGDYTIENRRAIAGIEQAFDARDTSGQLVVLKCYPATRLLEMGDPSVFLARETEALNRLAESSRAWRALPHFFDEAHDLYVVPVVPPRLSRSLEASYKQGDPERPNGQLDEVVGRSVVIDAFQALTEVHDEGMAHRALHPSRVWLGRAMRVSFSDFHLARIDGVQSIAAWEPDGDISEDYRAPESAASVGTASAKSDVFSLSLCLIEWLLGRSVTDMTHAEIAAVLTAKFTWASPLLEALRPQSERPTARELAAALVPERQVQPSVPVGDEFVVGGRVAGRYRIVELLGEGGFATSWKVFDEQADHLKVLKQFKQARPDVLEAEYSAWNSIAHDNCGRVYDRFLGAGADANSYLVSSFAPGQSLATNGVDRSVEEIRSVAGGILSALTYIHSKDLVHGDVTPANIIVENDGSGRAVLIDFGLSTAAGERPVGATPRFAAPEVREGKPATHLSDLFGFAASLAAAMLGRDATRYDNGELKILVPSQPEEDAWGVEGGPLLKAIFDGLAADPAQRPQSAAAFHSAIKATLARPTIPKPGPAPKDLTEVLNPHVDSLRRLYRGSAAGNAGNRGLDDDFAKATYVPTKLDTELLPRVLAGDLDVVLLSGNPGDGKTSVLVKLGDELRERGATVLHEDEAGWRLELDGRQYISVFDASESHGDLTSDELVGGALEPVAAGQNATALIAINDGRLLQFFADNAHRYEEWSFSVQDQLEGKATPDDRLALVDLKQRSLASLGGEPGLASRVLTSLTDDPFWSDCNTCIAHNDCPILHNRTLLRETGRDTFNELVRISHLRRRRRFTFRDLRSAIAWLITGDRSCADVHAWRGEGRSALALENAAAPELAFNPESNDNLIREWSTLDPSYVAAPEVDRAWRQLGAASEAPALQDIAATARAAYFRTIPGVPSASVRAYKYLDEFEQMLAGDSISAVRNRLLTGLSRLVGAFGYEAGGLAMSGGRPEAARAVLHTVPAEEFSIQIPEPPSRYIESMPDRLVLHHSAGPRLVLTLDTAELILRSADGEVINDLSSEAILQEIEAFVSQLARRPSLEARIVDASGSVDVARVDGTSIVRLEQS
jgi:serine/threonine protein kinase